MPKETKELAVTGEAPAPLAPATYALVGLDPTQKRIHIPNLGREYDVEMLESRLDLLELLHLQGWPHVQKSR